MALAAEPSQFPGAAHPIGGGIKPQGHQEPWIGAVAADLSWAGFNALVKAAQIQAAHHLPDHSHGMIRIDQIIRRLHRHHHLLTIRQTQTNIRRWLWIHGTPYSAILSKKRAKN